ncbi:MAG: alpha/beta hydrolase, partial [Planctomycetota bacterium]
GTGTAMQEAPRRRFASLLALGALAGVGCRGTKLMPTPNIYLGGRYALFEDLHPSLRTSKVDLLYVTDRSPVEEEGRLAGYDHGRSTSAAFGSCVVEIGRDVPWETLLRESTRRDRTVSLPLRVREVTELGRFPVTPWPLVEREGRLVDDPAVAAEDEAVAARFREEVRRRLALTPEKEAFLYVHGYHNRFEYAACVLAEFWHFGGRIGVPISYSWPAGAPGLLRSYTHDRESGQFTIHHLKQLLRLVTSIPEVERINVVCHSRGTDVLSSALRELLLEERAAGRDPRQSLRIRNVVMASPDIDLDVFLQRFVAARFYQVAERITVYCSRRDKALGFSRYLFDSRRRLGRVRPEDFTEEEKALLVRTQAYDFVDARVKTGFLGHGYYHSNPAVSSDLILLLRYGAKAGSEARPLVPAMPCYWGLESESYPFPEPP